MATTFPYQPTLYGSNIRLRPLLEHDFEELFRVASDPAIWEQHPQSNRYQHDVFTRFFADALASEGGALIAENRQANEIIGSSRFHGFDAKAREIEIGWSFLARAYWGGSFNAEMKALMLNHAFEYVDSVIFRIGSANYRSQKAVQKIGACLVPSRTQTNDDGSTTLVYCIKKEEWQARANAERYQ